MHTHLIFPLNLNLPITYLPFIMEKKPLNTRSLLVRLLKPLRIPYYFDPVHYTLLLFQIKPRHILTLPTATPEYAYLIPLNQWTSKFVSLPILIISPIGQFPSTLNILLTVNIYRDRATRFYMSGGFHFSKRRLEVFFHNLPPFLRRIVQWDRGDWKAGVYVWEGSSHNGFGNI